MNVDNLNIGTLDFEKAGGLVTAIAQNYCTKEILMLAYQDKKAVQKTLETGEMWFYSRSRQKLWHKGETSGNYLAVEQVFFDCDGDTLLYKVRPSGPVCHTGKRTCFGEGEFCLARLEEIILQRQNSPKPDSYTKRLLADNALLLDKIKEESEEVIQAVRENEGKDQVIWEAADLLYHVLVLLVRNGVSLADVEKELSCRSNTSAAD